MPRRREVPKREILPDPKYREADVSKFINVVMLHGKKAVAEGIVYGAFEYIESTAKKSPLDVFQQALAIANRSLRLKAEEWEAQTIRYLWKFGRPEDWPSVCVGLENLRKRGLKSPSRLGLQTSY